MKLLSEFFLQEEICLFSPKIKLYFWVIRLIAS